MNICFIIGTLGRGGAEKQLVYMLRALVRAGENVWVLCLTKGEAHEEEIRSLGIDVEYVGASPNRLLRLLAIIRRLRAKRPDVVQSSHFYTNIYAGAAGLILGVPSIGAVRNNLVSELRVNGIFGRLQLRLPNAIIANSEEARGRAISLGMNPARISLVKNVIERSRLSRKGRPDGGPFTFLFAGRLSPQKMPGRFIDMATELIEYFPEKQLSFLIAGDGELRTGLERQAQNAALAGRLEFLGKVNDMGPVFQRSDVLVSTSEYEGTPNVILEAMSQGLPVIANDVGGVAQLIGGDCGILVDAGDAVGLTAAAVLLLNDPDLRRALAKRAMEKVAREHSPEGLYAQLARIYSTVIAEQGPEERTEAVV